METGQARTVAPTYMGWSIFNTFCCCLPLGIAAIIYSNKAQTANALGQTAEAMEASRTAKMLNIVALVLGMIIIIVYVTLKVNSENSA